MKTKFEHLLSTLGTKDVEAIISLIPTSIMEGNQKHIAYLQYRNTNEMDEKKNIPVTERLLMSDLTKMMEKYIVIKNSLASAFHYNHTLLEYYRIHENEKLFSEAYKSMQNQEGQALRNEKTYQQNADILYEKWQFDQVKSRFSNADAEDIIHDTDVAIISKKLMQTVTFATQSTLISKKINTQLIDHLESYIIEHGYLAYPCIALYYYAWKLILYPEDVVWFEKFNEMLEPNEHLFPHEELKNLYFQGINYCIRKHNSGDKAFSQKLLNYYKIALSKKYLLTNGYLSKNTYRNINTIALRMGRYDEAKEISTDNVQYLRKEEKDSAFRFNMANIYYATEKYTDALESLRNIEFDDHLSNLFAKTLMLKIYYETKSERLLDSHLDAMNIYLTRKKIIGYHKTNYSNIVKYTRKLIRLNRFDSKAKAKLAEQIRTEKLLPDRDWLLRQVEV